MMAFKITREDERNSFKQKYQTQNQLVQNNKKCIFTSTDNQADIEDMEIIQSVDSQKVISDNEEF